MGEQGNGQISTFDPEGNLLSQFTIDFVEGRYPELFALAVNADGSLYMSDPYSNRLILLDFAGNAKVLLSDGKEKGQVFRPFQLAQDVQGNVYVVEYGNNRIQKFRLAEH